MTGTLTSLKRLREDPMTGPEDLRSTRSSHAVREARIFAAQALRDAQLEASKSSFQVPRTPVTLQQYHMNTI